MYSLHTHPVNGLCRLRNINILILFGAKLYYILLLLSVFQNKNASSGHSVGDFSSVASFSTKTYISPETSYIHSPATSASVPKHKSVGDIPM